MNYKVNENFYLKRGRFNSPFVVLYLFILVWLCLSRVKGCTFGKHTTEKQELPPQEKKEQTHFAPMKMTSVKTKEALVPITPKVLDLRMAREMGKRNLWLGWIFTN